METGLNQKASKDSQNPSGKNKVSRFILFLIDLNQREHKQEEQQAEGEGEADSPLNGEPDAGLDPRTLRS